MKYYFVIEGDEDTVTYIRDSVQDLYCDNDDELDDETLRLNNIVKHIDILKKE